MGQLWARQSLEKAGSAWRNWRGLWSTWVWRTRSPGPWWLSQAPFCRWLRFYDCVPPTLATGAMHKLGMPHAVCKVLESVWAAQETIHPMGCVHRWHASCQRSRNPTRRCFFPISIVVFADRWAFFCEAANRSFAWRGQALYIYIYLSISLSLSLALYLWMIGLGRPAKQAKWLRSCKPGLHGRKL